MLSSKISLSVRGYTCWPLKIKLKTFLNIIAIIVKINEKYKYMFEKYVEKKHDGNNNINNNMKNNRILLKDRPVNVTSKCLLAISIQQLKRDERKNK